MNYEESISIVSFITSLSSIVFAYLAYKGKDKQEQKNKRKKRRRNILGYKLYQSMCREN